MVNVPPIVKGLILFTIGRKNWLFSGSPKGAEARAVVYNIIETAKTNGLKPYDYFQFYLKIYNEFNLKLILNF